MAAHEYINPDQHLYHDTNLENAKSILKSNEVSPSSAKSIAGASGIYAFSDPKDAGSWDKHTVTLQPTQKLKIHKDINDFPHLTKMRTQQQFSNEYYEGEPDLDEIYESSGFPVTEKSARNAKDVSAHLESKGYHGHRDSLLGSDVVIYNPEHLRITGMGGKID